MIGSFAHAFGFEVLLQALVLGSDGSSVYISYIVQSSFLDFIIKVTISTIDFSGGSSKILYKKPKEDKRFLPNQ